MRAVLTRVTEASVSISGSTVAEIGQGYLVLLGVHTEDKPEQAAKMADRIAGLRIFEDEAGKMNRNLAAVGGAVLLVSQFTLYADTRSRRPGFTAAARPDVAVPLYEQVIADLRGRGFHVETGVFGADMAVQSVNDGPVTILLET
ncbi:MAG: D-tyrosyl-tRNA(Tyr) deacylase [Oscillospiraceae bacterium]|nr:D-tyrosyl-tRNA(Tyr) deacylase [Oscillospiraceae bacterium]